VPAYNFERTPIIQGRDPWWLHKYSQKPEHVLTYEALTPIHMPSQSWFPFFAGIGFLIFGVSFCLHGAAVPGMGYAAISGLLLTVCSIIAWSLEGPGGYYIMPKKEGCKQQQQLDGHRYSCSLSV